MRKRGLVVHTVLRWGATGLLILMILFGQIWRESPVLYAESTDAPPVVDGWVEVSTPQQLIYIDTHQEAYLNQKIRLKKDIELPSDTNWIPIGGNGKAPFSGTFDGRGYRISGVRILGNMLSEIGFFGQVSGKIRNVGVEVTLSAKVNIENSFSTGGLVGMLDGGSIDHAYSMGRVEGDLSNFVSFSLMKTGGLVGEAKNATISASYSTADVVSGSGRNMYVGGLVGFQDKGLISNSFAKGEVTGPPFRLETTLLHMGGFLGFLNNGREDSRTVEDSYSTGWVNAGDVQNMSQFIGGFVGDFISKSRFSGLYFDTESSKMSDGAGFYAGNVNSQIYGKTTAEMKQASTFQGWDFENTWAIHEEVNGGYPYLKPMILTEEIPDATQNESYRYKLEGYGYDSSAVGLSWQVRGCRWRQLPFIEASRPE